MNDCVVMFFITDYSSQLIVSGIKMDWDSKYNCRAAPYTLHILSFVSCMRGMKDSYMMTRTACMMSIHAKRGKKSVDCSVLQKYRNGRISQLQCVALDLS